MYRIAMLIRFVGVVRHRAHAARATMRGMYDITPADIVPFLLAVVCALAAMLFGRHRDATRPYSLASAILYAVALGFFILGLVSWAMRLLH